MIIISSDNKKLVDIGSDGIWYSVFSTASMRLVSMKAEILMALDFLKTGKCQFANAFETARQINLIRDGFGQLSPEQAVYNMDKPSIPAPWSENLSGIVTSCGNLYTTADGKDLLYEVVCILTYAHYKKVNILAQK